MKLCALLLLKSHKLKGFYSTISTYKSYFLSWFFKQGGDTVTVRATDTHLCEHGLSILGDHGTLITVKGDKVIVEGLLGMFQHIVELSGAALEYTPEVPWNQRPANCFRRRENTTGVRQEGIGKLQYEVHL